MISFLIRIHTRDWSELSNPTEDRNYMYLQRNGMKEEKDALRMKTKKKMEPNKISIEEWKY